MKYALSRVAAAARDAPHAGARIEMRRLSVAVTSRVDAPHAGARIEIAIWRNDCRAAHQTPPTRGRELKCYIASAKYVMAT